MYGVTRENSYCLPKTLFETQEGLVRNKVEEISRTMVLRRESSVDILRVTGIH